MGRNCERTDPVGWDTRYAVKHDVAIGESWAALQERLVEAEAPAGRDRSGCPTFDDLLQVFRQHLHMSADYEGALRIICATVYSASIPGDQIWVYLVSPPGGGKTKLLSQLRGSPLAVMVSTLTRASLISGQNTASGDPSLLARLNRKSLIIKDFTELLDKNQVERDETMATLRGAYDNYVNRSFGNGVVRDYKDISFSLIAAVTPKIHGVVKTSLGERFLKYQFSPLDQVDEITQVMTAIDSVGTEDAANEVLESALSAFVSRPVPDPLPELPQVFKARLVALCRLVARLRAKPDREQWGAVWTPVLRISGVLSCEVRILAGEYEGQAVWVPGDFLKPN